MGILINSILDINMQNRYGDTPLNLAAKLSNPQIYNLISEITIIDYTGGQSTFFDTKIQNADGLTASDIRKLLNEDTRYKFSREFIPI